MGVAYNPKKRRWGSSFYRSAQMEKPHQRWFKTKEEAEDDFNYFKRIYSPKRLGFHDYTGFENRFLKVICLINVTESNGGTVYLAQNKTDWKFRTIRARQLSKNPDLSGAPMPYRHMHKGYTEINRNGKILYQATLGVKGKRHIIGNYDSKEEAHKAYIAGIDSYYFAPTKDVEAYRQRLIESWDAKSKARRLKASRSMKRTRKLPYKYVFPAKGGYCFSIQIKIDGEKHSKYSTSLSTVLEYRNKFLKEHNLPIPDDRKD